MLTRHSGSSKVQRSSGMLEALHPSPSSQKHNPSIIVLLVIRDSVSKMINIPVQGPSDPGYHHTKSVFLFLLQVGTSFTGTPCRLVAWCMKVNSPQSNLLWTCMMRTKPDFFKNGLLGVSPFEI